MRGCRSCAQDPLLGTHSALQAPAHAKEGAGCSALTQARAQTRSHARARAPGLVDVMRIMW